MSKKLKALIFKVNNGNEKLGKSIKVINVPAGITCQCDAPCNSDNICYAKKGTFGCPTVKNCYANNLAVFLADPVKAELDILSQMPYMGFCRIHASGDIPNVRYLEMLVSLCNKLPNVKFMAYTKKYNMINTYLDAVGQFPDNLTMIFSLWDAYPCDNRHNLPTTQVILTKGNIDPINDGYKCDGLCEQCYKCWMLKKGDNVLFNQH